MKAIATLAVVFGLVTYCGAQNTIGYADIQNAPSVSGALMVHMPANLTPLSRTTRPSIHRGRKGLRDVKRLESGTAMHYDRLAGALVVSALPQSRTYRIKFIKAGFSQLRIRLRVEHGAKPLTVEMSVAT
jgi:hypothetical protein